MRTLADIKLKIQKIWILAAMTCCLSCIFFDNSLIPIALPTIQKEFGFSGLFLQWILNIFYISTAVCVIFAGKLSDTLGRRKVFCVGIFLYIFGAFAIAFSTLPFMILFFRAVQGIATAFMIPSAMTILMSEFSNENLGKALGLSAGISSVFLCVGPFIGGVVTEFMSWRINFILPVPLCSLALILTMMFVPKGEKNHSKLDIKGLILLVLGLSILMFALMQAKYWGVFSAKLLNYTLISSTVFTILYYHSKLIEFPLLDLSLFKIDSFVVGLILAFITQFAAIYPIFIAIFFQKALYLSPIESGAYIVVANLPILFCAPAAGILTDNRGATFPVRCGFFVLLLSMLAFIAYTYLRKQYIIFLALASFGSSQSLISTPLSTIALKDVPLYKKGLAAGVYNTVRFLASAFGIVAIGMVGYYYRISSLQKMVKVESLPKWMEATKIDEILKMSGCIQDNLVQVLKLINTKSFFISMNAMSLFISLFVCLGLLLTFLYLCDYKKA